jgi:hypothetical protein
MARRDSVAGTPGSSASNTTCAVMMAGTRPAAALKGASSTWRNRSRSCPNRGSARWLSTSVSPCPGKCLPHAMTPASINPSAKGRAKSMTACAVAPNERSPMMGFSGLVFTSSTGAKFTLKPSTRSCAPSCLAAARMASGPRLASSEAGGSVSTGSRRRATRPPSWSTAMSGSEPAAWSARYSRVASSACCTSGRLRLNRMTPARAPCAASPPMTSGT